MNLMQIFKLKILVKKKKKAKHIPFSLFRKNKLSDTQVTSYQTRHHETLR